MFDYYSRYEQGHRNDFMFFMNREFDAKRVSLKDSLFTSKVLLFAMYEEHPLLFLLVAVARKIQGKATSALLFRVDFASKRSGLKDMLKKLALSINKKLGCLKVYSIVSDDVLPSLRTYVHGSFYDFQFWDLQALGYDMKSDCVIPHGGTENTRVAIGFLGKQDESKGVNYILPFLNSFGVDRPDLIVRGKFSIDAQDVLERLRLEYNCDVINEFVDNDQLFNGYFSSDLIWCCYDPLYDQSSGILGRALQLGRVPIVRANSIAEGICRKLKVSYYSFDTDVHVSTFVHGNNLDVQKFRARQRAYFIEEVLDL